MEGVIVPAQEGSRQELLGMMLDIIWMRLCGHPFGEELKTNREDMMTNPSAVQVAGRGRFGRVGKNEAERAFSRHFVFSWWQKSKGSEEVTRLTSHTRIF